MPILAAGFSAFPGAPVNPTEDLAKALADGSAAPRGAVEAIVLPVEWAGSWPALRAAIERARPRTVLLFGLHARAERFRVELVARNHRELGRPDAVNGFPAGPSILDGPPTLPARLPWDRVAAALRAADVDFEWSTNAGSYLCNETLYRLAFHAEALGVEQFGFFHMPMSDERIPEFATADALPEVFLSLPFAQMVRAAGALIGELGGA
ncbi:hypothetical protein [Jiella sp. M17.18]|uniref:pyroglutamyl-peptidase I family protein n=1 Tax=Jiella sp. M17.18 TaxID=3234247 RepID=UPI0034DEF61E